MPKIAVIIVTYNAMRWIKKCFESLRHSSVPLQVYVVDNSSTDGTPHFINEHFPEVKIIQADKNLGFGKANNIGIEAAYKTGADFFYLMNQDAWLFEDSVEKMLQVYENFTDKEEIGILSPMHLDGTIENLDIFLDKYIAHNFKNRIISDLYFKRLKPYYEMKFINAAHWLIPKKTIETVGGFNPYFFHYGEDIEYANRVKFHRKKIILVPGSRAVHDSKQNLDKVNYQLYEDLTVETNILNPILKNAFWEEKKSLYQSMIKAALSARSEDFKILLKKYRKINSEKKKLETLAHTVKSIGASFLNL